MCDEETEGEGERWREGEMREGEEREDGRERRVRDGEREREMREGESHNPLFRIIKFKLPSAYTCETHIKIVLLEIVF